jgi:hypothetical protein
MLFIVPLIAQRGSSRFASSILKKFQPIREKGTLEEAEPPSQRGSKEGFQRGCSKEVPGDSREEGEEATYLAMNPSNKAVSLLQRPAQAPFSRSERTPLPGN